ncbi:MAG TPA: serine hydrolase domain-containing protein [Caulobacteraceae bacterium]|jgi:CubicO group peptidase (beta-lactamase class C family)|nr:serine hydrolase domain-containing protein [Caulobacteraceae bacterium]
MSDLVIGGDAGPAFGAAAEAFAENFRSQQEVGASFCVFKDGEKVVDLWGGHVDAARSRPWERDTLVNVWSTTKGVMALCVARLNDQGLLENDRPVADYWPEFAANGKGKVTVAQLFSHQAGLAGPGRQLTEADMLDTDRMAELMAAEPPHWPIGTRSGYHAFSIGPLGDGLFKRVTGKSVGQYFRDEIGAPAGADFHMGLAADQDARVAEIMHDEFPQSGGVETFNEFQRLAQVNVPIRFEMANLRAWRAQGTPSAGGTGNARGLASLYSALVTDRRLGGVELVSQAALDAATTVQIENEDLVLRFPISWGVGFAVNKAMGVYGPNPRAFGHHGWGGSFAFADPDRRLAIAYAMNFMREPQGGLDPRFEALIRSVYASI